MHDPLINWRLLNTAEAATESALARESSQTAATTTAAAAVAGVTAVTTHAGQGGAPMIAGPGQAANGDAAAPSGPSADAGQVGCHLCCCSHSSIQAWDRRCQRLPVRREERAACVSAGAFGSATAQQGAAPREFCRSLLPAGWERPAWRCPRQRRCSHAQPPAAWRPGARAQGGAGQSGRRRQRGGCQAPSAPRAGCLRHTEGLGGGG